MKISFPQIAFLRGALELSLKVAFPFFPRFLSLVSLFFLSLFSLSRYSLPFLSLFSLSQRERADTSFFWRESRRERAKEREPILCFFVLPKRDALLFWNKKTKYWLFFQKTKYWLFYLFSILLAQLFVREKDYSEIRRERKKTKRFTPLVLYQ